MAPETKDIAPSELAAAVAEEGRGRSRYLFLDFDGTLVDFALDPEKVVVSDAAAAVLRRLAETSQTRPVIVSGRTRNFLESRLAELNLDIAAEHGRLFRRHSTSTWEVIPPQIAPNNLAGFIPLLTAYVHRVPGSLIEIKEFSLTWHYRAVDADYLPLAAELEQQISKCIPPDLMLVSGDMVLEICPARGGKGRFIDWYFDQSGQIPDKSSYCVAIGDDRTDEEMFRSLRRRRGRTVKVGLGETCADLRLPDSAAVVAFLGDLLAAEI